MGTLSDAERKAIEAEIRALEREIKEIKLREIMVRGYISPEDARDFGFNEMEIIRRRIERESILRRLGAL